MNSKLLVAVSVAFLAACQASSNDPALGTAALRISSADTVVSDGAGGAAPASLVCPAPTACFHLQTNGANITHVFVDVDSCCADGDDDFDVLVDGKPVTKLHDHGGPCQDLARDVWFPLQGNQSEADVCVDFHGYVPSHVSVGAKAKDECVATSIGASCAVCDGGPASCGAGTGAGGGGATSGSGGSGGSGATTGSGGSGGAGTTGAGGSSTAIPK